eukprot:scaffold406801_cov30-Prasinocladus_malaysianus.AAC.2
MAGMFKPNATSSKHCLSLIAFMYVFPVSVAAMLVTGLHTESGRNDRLHWKLKPIQMVKEENNVRYRRPARQSWLHVSSMVSPGQHACCRSCVCVYGSWPCSELLRALAISVTRSHARRRKLNMTASDNVSESSRKTSGDAAAVQ